jgi:hypothetical protein
MYTSGSSGVPKGVTILNSAIPAAVAGASSIVGEYLSPNDRLLAYPPLAHIIEFVFENASMFWVPHWAMGHRRRLPTPQYATAKAISLSSSHLSSLVCLLFGSRSRRASLARSNLAAWSKEIYSGLHYPQRKPCWRQAFPVAESSIA